MNLWIPWKRHKPQIIVAVTKRKEVDTSIASEAHKALQALRGAKVEYLKTPRERTS